MTDRELLENAAKAAGISILWDSKGAYEVIPGISGSAQSWNPLTDDGDEARLEATLQMHVEWYPGVGTVTVGTAEIFCAEPYGNNRQAARKRAGVRAAAAIGAAK